MQDDIRAVASGLGIGSGWLNGSVQSYLEILPTDFRARLRTLPHLGRLHVALLHRQDVIVMKLYAGRPQDLADVGVLGPTLAEIAFVRGQISRLRQIDAARTDRLEGFLDRYAKTAV